MKEYLFEPADETDLEAVWQLISQRIQWMDAVGIQQWNVTNYQSAYPKAYYLQKIEQKQLHVLRNEDRICAAVVLLEDDARWSGDPYRPAYYLHNFVSDTTEKGAGSRMLEAVTQLALAKGKQALRLDCSVSNHQLNAYYESRGFLPAGSCQEGAYMGLKREKLLEGSAEPSVF